MTNFGHYQTADTVHVVYPDGDAAVTISRAVGNETARALMRILCGCPERRRVRCAGRDRGAGRPSTGGRGEAVSELRAPDPTLVGHAGRVILTRNGPLVAHRERYEPEELVSFAACGRARRMPGLPRMMARDMAYSAVPCRECFPDAPQPGTVDRRQVSVRRHDLDIGELTIPDPYLSWQVKP
jgi:hypothetical protein